MASGNATAADIPIDIFYSKLSGGDPTLPMPPTTLVAQENPSPLSSVPVVPPADAIWADILLFYRCYFWLPAYPGSNAAH